MDLVRLSGPAHLRRVELALPLLAIGVGVASARSLAYGAAVAGAVLFVPAALRDVRLGLVLWVPLLFLDGSPMGNAAGKGAGLVVLLSWALRLPALARRGRSPERVRATGVVLLLLLGWVTASVLWSAAPSSSIADLWHWYAVALIFAVVATAVDELAWVIRIGGAALVGGVASSIAALGSGGLRASVGTSALRVQGAAGDPNFLAAWLLLAVLLGLGLLSTQRGGRLRVVTAVAMALLVLALLSTLSRGAYVATLATALTAAVLLRGRRLQVIAVVAGLTCGAGALAVRFPTAFRRVSANDRGDGRYDLWTVALRVVHDSPLHGIGVNAFPQVAADYMRQVSPLRATYLLVGQSHVVHNTYLQLLAELGGVGLALFLALVALSVTCALAARRAFAERGDRSGVVMTEAVLLAVTGVMVTSFFLSAQLDKLLWLVLALGPALLRVATAAPGAETAPDSHRQPAAVRV